MRTRMRMEIEGLDVESFGTGGDDVRSLAWAVAYPTERAVCFPASGAGSGLSCGMTDCTCRLDHC